MNILYAQVSAKFKFWSFVSMMAKVCYFFRWVCFFKKQILI